MNVSNHLRLQIIGVILSGYSAVFCQNLALSASVNRTSVGLNQEFELSLELSGSDANQAPQPDLPNIDVFASFLGSSSATNMQFINGKMSVSKIYTYRFMATKVGKFKIPTVELSYRGKHYATQAITFEVTKSRSAASTPPTSSRQPGSTDGDEIELSDQLFLEATADKKQIYQNEPVVVTYKIYTSINVSQYGISKLPNAVGFWTEDLEQPQRPRVYQEVRNGRQFQVAEIKKVALFPQGPGIKTIDRMEIECQVTLPRRRRRRDIFDDFFETSFFGRTVQRRVSSNAISVEVLPLPESGRPRNFSGAVGKYSLTSTIDKTRVKTNEAISLKVKISGAGNVKILAKPEIEFPSDFEVYDPKVVEHIDKTGGRVVGFKSFEYVVIPRFPGDQVIKSISFSYFDPSLKAYKTESTRATKISVEKGSDQFVSVGVGNSKEDVKFIGQDIRFIQVKMPEFIEMGTVFYKQSSFYFALLLPILLSACAFGYRAYQDKLSSNVAYARSRRANQMAAKRLKKAHQRMGEGDRAEFYSEVANALIGFVGDKLNVAPAGLITDEVSEMLEARGAAKEKINSLIECLRRSDYERFAPSESGGEAMKDFLEKAKGAIVELDREL